MALRSQEPITPESPARALITQRFHGLEQFEISRLGGSNNFNWKLSNEEKAEQLVIRLEESMADWTFLNALSQTPVNEYLSNDFVTIYPTADIPYTMIVSEFAEGGDLYNARKKNLSQADFNTLTLEATDKIGQITSFCQEMQRAGGMHSDIKLTNFLLRRDGRVIVADKKGLLKTTDKKLISNDIPITTKVYAPPEYLVEGLPKTPIDPEEFMTYQIGLALYDYLIMPEISETPSVKLWSEHHPLDFDKPYFKSEHGMKMRDLISKMTYPTPPRAKLTEVQQELQTLSRLVNPMQTTQNASVEVKQVQPRV